ncbi:MAG: TIGR00153 family protein [Archaeoglobales archaeon]|nr:MAG: TIGR00153 family protein [Archaeoglobales archaeon]
MMFFKRVFFGGKLEKEVLDLIENHLEILINACETFKLAFEMDDTSLIRGICKLEDDGDRIRREIAIRIYEGAFLPYLRPNIYRFSEVVDEAIDKLEDTVYDYLNLKSRKILDTVKGYILKIAELNLEASKHLFKAYKTLLEGKDLGEITTKIRFYEREIDSIKNMVKAEMRNVEVDIWEAITFVSLLEHIVSVSDLIEDAGDIIQIINVSLR